MKILYVATKYESGNQSHGLSFEHWNFYDTLVNMGHDIVYFDYPTLSAQSGRGWMNHRLLDVARATDPDLLFCVLFGDYLDPAVMTSISRETDVPTLNWFCDDHFRFESLSRDWAPCFNFVVTTARSALPKYEAIGYESVIKSQWACNDRLYKRLELPPVYDVTFVGAAHGNRRAVVQTLRRAGIDVRTWGLGWDSWQSGRIDQEEMIRIACQSRIALNLSNAPAPRTDVGSLARSGLQLVGSLAGALVGRALPELWPPSDDGSRRVRPSLSAWALYTDQLKGRNFEVPGCGTFLLTGHGEDLEQFYDIGGEVVTFADTGELIDKIHYFLDHEEERRRVAAAGYERTIAEHTYDRRFREIFDRVGLNDLAEPMTGAGGTEEVQPVKHELQRRPRHATVDSRPKPSVDG
jgi:spore maturation protein CgeB